MIEQLRFQEICRAQRAEHKLTDDVFQFSWGSAGGRIVNTQSLNF